MSELTVSNLTDNSYAEYKHGYAELSERFQSVKDKQGAIGSLWDSVKGITGVGISEEKCTSMLEKFKNGEITFEQAANYIDRYDTKQNDTTDLIANIVTGVAAIAATTVAGVMGGPLLPILAIGAGVGAAVKTGFKFFDRATNNVQNDEYDAKLVIKDVITGAVTGAASAAPSGIKSAIAKGDRALAITKGIECGAICGAVGGSTSYMTDVALGDKDFSFEDLITTTGTSAFVSGTVGGAVGAGLFKIADSKGLAGKSLTLLPKETNAQIIAKDSASSSARKVLANMEKNIIAA